MRSELKQVLTKFRQSRRRERKKKPTLANLKISSTTNKRGEKQCVEQKNS
jgi:hypothetical protein